MCELTMREELLQLHVDELRERLYPHLAGKVFHVTTEHAAISILTDGFIRNNRDARFAFTFGQSQVSFFRALGCVSVFDLRGATDDQVQEVLGKYNFLNPVFCANRPVFIILANSLHSALLPWTAWNNPRNQLEMVIPRVEAGFPGDVPVDRIEALIRVQVDDPGPPLGTWSHLAWMATRDEEEGDQGEED